MEYFENGIVIVDIVNNLSENFKEVFQFKCTYFVTELCMILMKMFEM